MARSYFELAFTETVKAMQEANGSRSQYARAEAHSVGEMELTEAEAAFIGARDSFYMASVSETGWPYVQFRGGPAGFVHVVNSRSLAFADFRGNRQYVSVGNIAQDERVALLLMDYANRRRLKVMARAHFVDASTEPALAARVAPTDYNARVERIAMLHVEAFDWNCPQHITPRYTEAEIRAAVQPLRERLRAAEAELARRGSRPVDRDTT